MSSNRKYLEDNSFGGFDVRVISNGMNSSLVIQDDLNLIRLVNFLISPPILPSLFITPRDWLSSLQIFPFNVNVGISNVNSGQLRVGGIVANARGEGDEDTVIAEDCYSQRVYNLGEYKITPYFNNFADYNGYTKIQIYLPMFGFVDVNPNDVMNKYIQIRMTVDVVSGMGVYYICTSNVSIPLSSNNVVSDDTNINRILSTYSFQLGYSVPIGSSDAPQIYRNIVGGAVKATATAVGAYTVSSLGATGGTKTTKIVKTARNQKTGRQLTKGTKTTTETYDRSNYQFGKAITECFEYGAQALTSMHMSAQSDRVNNPATLAQASESVHIIIQRPKLKPVDSDYNHLYGQPLGEVKQLSELSGYTEITNIHLEDSGFDTATQEELLMIMQELSNGVILGDSSTPPDLSNTLSGTWVFNKTLTDPYGHRTKATVNFESNNNTFYTINVDTKLEGAMQYWGPSVNVYIFDEPSGWTDQAYRTITFDGTQTVSEEFYTWFTSNAVKQ